MRISLMTRWLWQAGRALVLALGVTGALQAGPLTTVYSNLGSPPGFDEENGWLLDGGVVSGQMLAVAFTPGQTVQFADATLALGIIFSNLAQSPLHVYLAADATGLPGSNLADLALGTEQSLPGWPPGNLVTYVCSLPCPTLHAAAQYWLVAEIPDLGPDYFDTQSAWNWNATLDYSTGANFAFNDTQFGTGWLFGSSSGLRPAFEIEAVPEPGSALLLAFGLAAVAGRLRRRLRHP